MRIKPALLLHGAMLLTPLSAVAELPDMVSQPADAAVHAPAPAYESAFRDYRSYRDEKLAPWRDINDEVARVGGHIGIMRAAVPDQAPASTAPRTPSHSGH